MNVHGNGSPESALHRAAGSVGTPDLFVFRRVSDDRFLHLGGVGRGEGWAGNIELVLADEPAAEAAMRDMEPRRVRHTGARRVVGPYYARGAAFVPVSGDVMAVFGAGEEELPSLPGEELTRAAREAAEAIAAVSPAKRLADELEVLHAVGEIMAVGAEDVDAVMRAIADTAARALSCELAVVKIFGEERVAISDRGSPLKLDSTAAAAGMRRLTERVESLPACVQDGAREPLPPEFGAVDRATSYFLVPIGDPTVAQLLVVHTDAQARGFTMLCQELGVRLAEASETVLRSAMVREMLRREVERVSRMARVDPLTGLGNLLAWKEMLTEEERCAGERHPAAVVLVDLEGLWTANHGRGHRFGDLLLKELAEVVCEVVGDRDRIARVRDDQLAVLLPGAGEDESVTVVRRLQEAIDRHPGLEGHPLSARIGHGSRPPERTLAEAERVADGRLREAKVAVRG